MSEPNKAPRTAGLSEVWGALVGLLEELTKLAASANRKIEQDERR